MDMGHTKRTRIVKQILASLSKCFFAMRIAFIFKFYSKFFATTKLYFFTLGWWETDKCRGPKPSAERKGPTPKAERKGPRRNILGREKIPNAERKGPKPRLKTERKASRLKVQG